MILHGHDTSKCYCIGNMSCYFLDHPRTVHSDTFISLTVSVSGIVLTDMSSGEVISRHDMQGISFASGGEKVISAIFHAHNHISKELLLVSGTVLKEGHSAFYYAVNTYLQIDIHTLNCCD